MSPLAAGFKSLVSVSARAIETLGRCNTANINGYYIFIHKPYGLALRASRSCAMQASSVKVPFGSRTIARASLMKSEILTRNAKNAFSHFSVSPSNFETCGQRADGGDQYRPCGVCRAGVQRARAGGEADRYGCTHVVGFWNRRALSRLCFIHVASKFANM